MNSLEMRTLKFMFVSFMLKFGESLQDLEAYTNMLKLDLFTFTLLVNYILMMLLTR